MSLTLQQLRDLTQDGQTAEEVLRDLALRETQTHDECRAKLAALEAELAALEARPLHDADGVVTLERDKAEVRHRIDALKAQRV